jgi:hypothetical protein
MSCFEKRVSGPSLVFFWKFSLRLYSFTGCLRHGCLEVSRLISRGLEEKKEDRELSCTSMVLSFMTVAHGMTLHDRYVAKHTK